MFQRFSSPPTIFVTVTHGVTNRTQDAMALWVEDLKAESFKICLREAKIFDGPHKNLKIVGNPEFYRGCPRKIFMQYTTFLIEKKVFFSFCLLPLLTKYMNKIN